MNEAVRAGRARRRSRARPAPGRPARCRVDLALDDRLVHHAPRRPPPRRPPPPRRSPDPSTSVTWQPLGEAHLGRDRLGAAVEAAGSSGGRSAGAGAWPVSTAPIPSVPLTRKARPQPRPAPAASVMRRPAALDGGVAGHHGGAPAIIMERERRWAAGRRQSLSPCRARTALGSMRGGPRSERKVGGGPAPWAGRGVRRHRPVLAEARVHHLVEDPARHLRGSRACRGPSRFPGAARRPGTLQSPGPAPRP
jgi:hypothetical protein